MKYFSLPAELLKLAVYNFVDIDGPVSTRTKSSASIDNSAAMDKELLMSIEELERKFSIGETDQPVSSSAAHSASSTSTSTSTAAMTNPSAKFIRPDVTWLRRTEYISSVKNNPNGTATPNLSVDEAKEILNEAVKFEEIIEQVCGSFSAAKAAAKHPLKKNLELLQSFPINYSNSADTAADYVNFLILGDNSQATENSILQISPKQQETTPTISLFNPSSENPSTFKSSGDFDIQKSESQKSFVLMLPTRPVETAAAVMAKINSNFSLRKRRAVARGGEKTKKAKVIKVQRGQ